MRASPIRRKGAASFEDLKPACQVLILHEDFSAYSRAVEVCRRVMERFASELDFDVKCWNFIELADPNCARHAAKTAGGADIILLAMHTTEMPLELDRWVDFYFIDRFRAEGVLALVLNPAATSPLAGEKLRLRLQQLTARLGMDFIPLPPEHDAMVLDALTPSIVARPAPE
jgi:hypothetical protein